MPFTLTGAMVRERRMALGISQTDLARACSLTRFAICKWESRKDHSIPRAQYENVLQALLRLGQAREDAHALARRLQLVNG